MTLTASRRRLLVVALLTVSFLGALDHTMIATSLATIAGELGAVEQMSWIVVGYTMASTVLLPVLGKLGDMFGPRVIFLTSLVVFLITSFACGLASTMELLIVARIAQGMSSSGLHLMSQTILAHVTTPRERPKYMSLIGAAFPVAILIGPVLGGAIADTWGWPWVFWVKLPVGVVALVFATVAVPRIERRLHAKFDLPGTALFSVGFVALVLGVTWIGSSSLRPVALIALAVAVFSVVALFVVESYVADPLIPLKVFSNRTVGIGTALSATMGLGLFSITSYLPTYVQMAYQTSAAVSGLVPISTVMGMLVANLFSGFMVSRTGRYRVYPVVGSALGAAGLTAMALLPAGLPLWMPMIVMFVVGAGTGSFMSLVVSIVQSAAPVAVVGSVTATVNLVRSVGSTVATALIGGAIGVSVTAMLPRGLDASTLTPQAVQAAGGALQAGVAGIYQAVFVPIFFALAGVFLVALVLSMLLPATSLSDDRDEQVAMPAQVEA